MQYDINWNLYKHDLSQGLAHFQLNEEFVDMTLAAEGHVVKVHRNIVAFASPYIKQMVQSIPCQHPVVFLNNVSHQVLKYLLEYIYTGEVQIPNHLMKSFLETANLLCIKGIDGSCSLDQQNNQCETNTVPSESNDLTEEYRIPAESSLDDQFDSKSTRNVAAHIKISGKNMFEITPVTQISNELPLLIPNSDLTSEGLFTLSNVKENADQEMNEVVLNAQPNSNLEYEFDLCNQTYVNESDVVEVGTENVGPVITINYNENDNQTSVADINISEIVQANKTSYSPISDTATKEDVKDIIKARALTPLYTSSNRGCLQMMLNRYLYSCHHQSFQGRKRRWRCVDYRSTRCNAIIDTEDETMTRRSGSHNHPHHDSRILKKFKKNYAYPKIKDAVESIVENEKD